jgi:hypothetical protein
VSCLLPVHKLPRHKFEVGTDCGGKKHGVTHSPRTAVAPNVRRDVLRWRSKHFGIPEAFGVLAENSAGSGQSNTEVRATEAFCWYYGL